MILTKFPILPVDCVCLRRLEAAVLEHYQLLLTTETKVV